jgi:predicted Rossmann fold flavoprotein
VAGVATGEGVLPCRSAVLATGGASYPLTGSTGDGYALASALGHTVVPPRPSLVPLEAEPELCAGMQGLSLKNVRLTVRDGGKKPVFSDFGEMLFTHFGVSGPLVLSASAHMRDFDTKEYTLSIDLKPALDEATLDARLLRDFEKYANRDFLNALSDLAPQSLIPALIARAGIAPDKKVHSVTRGERRRLLELFKDFRLAVDGPRPLGEAIVTAGGVALGEISPKTMESKLIPGLHFAGEVMDLDAYTGGFNLQIAWSTAFAAAQHLCRLL